jgi:hypothetical protein
MKAILAVVAICTFVVSNMALAQDKRLEIVSPTAMPLSPPSGELEKLSSPPTSVDPKGKVHHKDSTKYSDFRKSLDFAKSQITDDPIQSQRRDRPPASSKDLSNIKNSFKPKQQRQGTLVAASPAGMWTDKGWTGLERFISVENVGVYRLTEFDLEKTNGKFYLAQDAVNANVDNSPAATKSFMDSEGNVIQEVVWVSKGKFHMLTYVPAAAPATSSRQAVTETSALDIAHSLQE